jgi:hypothetical protein
VVLDERGTRLTTAQLAERLRAWRGDGRDVALLIGGPDGLDPALKASADETLRLSDLTLPHAFARVLLAEALYRAWSRARRPPLPPRVSTAREAPPSLPGLAKPAPAQLLDQLGVRTSRCCPTPTKTPRRWSHPPRRAAGRYVQRVTCAKLAAARARLRRRGLPPAPILCADTTVALGRASWASRPMPTEARAMLRRCRAARTAC